MTERQSSLVNNTNLFLEAIDSIGRTIDVPRGRILYKQGIPAERLYVVEKGLVISRRSKSGERVLDMVHTPGQLFGIEVLYPGFPVYDSSAVVAAEGIVTSINKRDLDSVIQKSPEVVFDLMTIIAERAKAQEELYSRFSRVASNKTTLDIVMQASEEVSTPDGQVAVSKSDQAARIGLKRQQFYKWLKKYPQIPHRSGEVN